MGQLLLVLPHVCWRHAKQWFSAAYHYKADSSALFGLKGENPVISPLLEQYLQLTVTQTSCIFQERLLGRWYPINVST